MIRRILMLFMMLLATAAVQGKSLYWRSIDVEAQLDEQGRLHVAETQTFVFDGDWNGGERRFATRAGQSFQLEGVDLIDDLKGIPLTRGDLASVHHYDLIDGSTLRWRSRMPNDPPFANKELTYRIRYTLSGILRRADDQFLLNHDFAFPDRQGTIERIAVRLTLAPSWTGIQSPHTVRGTNLAPGETFVIRAQLRHQGSAEPSAVAAATPMALSYAFLALLIGGALALIARFLRYEHKAGRFASLAAEQTIDRGWLDRNVLPIPADVLSAAWADGVGATAVATVLAMLAQEKKIESSVEKRLFRRPKLKLRLMVDRSAIPGRYNKLIEKLFFDNQWGTDTDALRKRYERKGLDLAATIRVPIENQLAKLAKWMKQARPVDWKANRLLIGGTFFAMVVAGLWDGSNDGILVPVEALLGFVTLAIGSIAARANRRALDFLPVRIAAVIVLAGPLFALTAYYLLGASEYDIHVPTLVSMTAWNLALLSLILDGLRIDQAPEKIAMRKILLAARNYFRQQLRSPSPLLRDEWFPYLVAFGLGPKVDNWFRAHGQVASAESESSASTLNGSATSQSSDYRWTGRGGTFDGGGASGDWVKAAAGLDIAVSSASSSGSDSSSSSSGSSGSSDSSSSGGGGGGGW